MDIKDLLKLISRISFTGPGGIEKIVKILKELVEKLNTAVTEEEIGEILLSYYTKEEVETILNGYVTDTQIQAYYTKEQVDLIISALGKNSYKVAWDGSTQPTVANIPAGVVVTYNNTDYTGTLSASTNTINSIYLVGQDMYVTSKDGNIYSWVFAGTTELELKDYATKSEVSQLQQEVTDLDKRADKIVIPTTTNGAYIATNGEIGSVLPNPTAQSNYRYMMFPVSEGDFVFVNARGGSAQRPWAFVDSENKIISHEVSTTGLLSLVLTVPKNSAKIVINDRSNSTSFYIPKGSFDAKAYRMTEVGYIGYYSTPLYIIQNKIIKSSTNNLSAQSAYDLHVFDVTRYGGQTIKITTGGLPDANTIYGILACQKRDGTMVYVQNTIGNEVFEYEYTLPADAYKLVINKFKENTTKTIITCDGKIIESSHNHTIHSGCYPQPTIDSKFWDTALTQDGIIDISGNISLQVSGFKVVKYDISGYVGKHLSIMFGKTADSYSGNWAAFMVEDTNGNKSVEKDYLIGTLTAGIRYAVCGYVVQPTDKYLYVSPAVSGGFVSVVSDYDSGNLPILSPIKKDATELFEQGIGGSSTKGISQDGITKKIASVNLLDINDPDTLVDKYIDSQGNVHNSSGIRESGYIPLSPGQILKWTNVSLGATTWPYLVVVFYDKDKNFIGSNSNPSLLGYVQTNLVNCAFVRIAYATEQKDDIVISYNDNVTEYIPFYDVHSNHKGVKKNESDIAELREDIASITGDGIQWSGKKWYAYGTSITSVAQGKYAPYLAQMGNMILTNKGIPGGGIGNLGAYSTGQVRAAIMNTTDGKLEADLITLEVGANDVDANVPLGTIYDNDDTTLCGCLNMCIRYLQANTTAQIVIMPSPATKTEPNATDKYYEAQLLFQKICFINKCYWIDGCTGLGYSRINGNNTYTADNIHQTELGGYIFAKSIWSKLKSIPTWDTSIPS